MEQKINCRAKINTETKKIRVKIIKAPVVNYGQLRSIILERARALVL